MMFGYTTEWNIDPFHTETEQRNWSIRLETVIVAEWSDCDSRRMVRIMSNCKVDYLPSLVEKPIDI